MDKTVKPLRAFVAAALLGTIIAPIREAGAAAAPKDALFVPGEVVVALRGRLGVQGSRARASALAGKVGGRVAKLSARGPAAVIRVAPDADVKELARRLGAEKDVRFAEPNYIYRAAAASRPSDTLLAKGSGWDWVNAAIVWNNTTPSKNVCVIDTGVDYLHPDLTTARVIKGKDRVNEDADPMDDNGHGTHVAGIIVAKQNNAQGIAGVSPTAKVVAVKALNADGWGTSYDIQQAIRDCADRTDVSIITVSFSGPYSVLQKNAVDYATNVKNKLLVAAAGNEASETPYCNDETSPEDPFDPGQAESLLKSGIRSYPAGFATASNQYYWDGAACVDSGTLLHEANPAILSVGAGGAPDSGGDFSCRAEHSNFGEWVNVTAPGTDILSTTPWDRPFTMNSTEGLAARYGALSGTSAASAFVAGVAARAWGYKSSFTNAELAGYVKSTGRPIPAVGGELEEICQPETVWPASMGGATDVNVAAALDRGALIAEAIDAVSGLPLVGATIQAVQGSSVKASATLAFVPATLPEDLAGSERSPAAVELINLPALVTTTLKVSKSGYTTSATNAFVGGENGFGNPDGTIEAPRGGWRYAGYAAVPPRSGRFTVVSAWDRWEDRVAPVLTTALPDKETKASNGAIWDGQPADFVVGYDVCDYADLEGDSVGELLVFPNAQAVYQNWVNTHQIDNRAEAGYSALPQWTGTYVLSVFNADMDFDYRQGSLFVWRDGSLRKRVDMTDAGCAINGSFYDWWEAAAITSGKSGSVVIEAVNACKDSGSMVFPVSCVP